MVLWGWGRKNGVTFCLFCGFITVPQSTDSLSYLSNAVFQSYIYMLCSIWPASILLNKVLRLSKKKTKNKFTYLIWLLASDEIHEVLSFFIYLIYCLITFGEDDSLTRVCSPKPIKDGWVSNISCCNSVYTEKIITANEERTSCCCFLLYGLFGRNPLERVCHQVSLRCSPMWLSG